jgi:hypothetical protein
VGAVHSIIRDLVVPSGEFARLAALKTEINSEHFERLLWVDGAAGDVFQAPKLEAWIERYELSDFEWAAIKPSACAQRHLLGPA